MLLFFLDGMKTLKQILKSLENSSEINLFVIDLFCGAGGLSEGFELAAVNGQKCSKVVACINHDKNAIYSHEANIPDALHFIEDIRTVSISPIVALIEKIRELYPESKILLHASLECTNFSKAKGGQPRDADSRTLAEHLFRYLDAIDPDYLTIENVEEFMSWGDMDENGKPISKDRGRCYRKWVNEVKKYGYNFDYRILNSADFGAYTSRKRFFGIFSKTGLPIAWPEPTHSKAGTNDLFSTLKKWRPVKEVLDFEDEGSSIFIRKKPLSEKTLERIYAGLIKFVAGGKDAWILKYNSVNGTTGKHNPPGIDEPCPTVACQGRLGLIQTHFLSKYFSGDPYSKNISVDGPAHTIKCIDNHAIVNTKFLAAYYGNGINCSSVSKPCPTVPTKDRFNYVSPKFMCSYNFKDAGKDLNLPCPTLLTKDRLSLVSTRFLDMQYGASRCASIDMPAGTVTSNPKHGLVTCKPWVMNTNFSNIGSSVEDSSQVITANRKWHYLMNPQFASAGGDINKPCFTLIARMDKMPPYLVCTKSGQIAIEIYESDSPCTKRIKEFMAIYGIVDILMRMLKIPELKMIMGFPKDYVLIGTQADQKKFIGNAVEVNMAKVLCEALCTKLIKAKEIAA